MQAVTVEESLAFKSLSGAPFDYVVLDFETTGLSPKQDKIIEIGMIKVIKGELVDSFASFVNPQSKIPARITDITGITDDDVQDAPTDIEIAPVIHQFIGELPIIAHNASFDIGFLESLYRAAGLGAKLCYVDTLRLAREAFPDAPNHKLSTLADMLDLGEQEHRAASDVNLTNSLFLSCLYFSDPKKQYLTIPSPSQLTPKQLDVAKWVAATLVAAERDIEMLAFEQRAKCFRVSCWCSVLDFKLDAKSPYVMIPKDFWYLIDNNLLDPCPPSEGSYKMRAFLDKVPLPLLEPVLITAYDAAYKNYQAMKPYITNKDLKSHASRAIKLPTLV